MTANVGTVDRAVRIAVGALLVLAALMGWVGAWGWIGVLLIATGIFRFCPAYLPFGMSTCSTNSPKAK
ncbi:MAG: DUF2892 domain-containing protein [Rhizobacter sp.]|nr:DUF2892 domain-containing protein [Rhizobacter sp.]